MGKTERATESKESEPNTTKFIDAFDVNENIYAKLCPSYAGAFHRSRTTDWSVSLQWTEKIRSAWDFLFRV